MKILLPLAAAALASSAAASQIVNVQSVARGGAVARAPQTSFPFAVLDLGVLPGYESSSEGVDLNDAGQVLCRSTHYVGPSQWTTHSFVWGLGQRVDLGELPGRGNTFGTAINAQGDVVGWCEEPGAAATLGPRPFLWSGGVMIDLGLLPGAVDGRATAINDAGVVTGWCTMANGFARPWIWQNGVMTDIAFNSTYAKPSAIDAAGIVYGEAGIDGATYSAYFDTDEWHHTYIGLGTPMHCSEAGMVTGTGYHSLTWVAFRTHVGSTENWLPSLPGNTSCRGYGINDAGDVVGQAAGAAVVWYGNQIVPLYSQIDPSLGWFLSGANAIADTGWIAATGSHNGNTRAALVIPR